MQSLQAGASAAIAARDTGQLRACAYLEKFVHGHVLAGALHMLLVWLLDGPVGPFRDDWISQLRALTDHADPAEKDTVLAQFNTALASIPAENTIVGELRHMLSLPNGS